MNFAEAKVGTKLALGFSVVMVLLALIVGMSYWRLHSVNKIITIRMSDALVKERLAAEWEASTNTNGARTIIAAESLDPARQQQLQAKIKETSARITAIQEKLDTFEKSQDEINLFGKIADKRKAYVDARAAVFKEKTSNEENARALIQAKLEPALAEYTAMIDKMVDYHSSRAAEMDRQIIESSLMSQRLLLVLGVLAALLGAGVSWFITSSIKKQLGCEPSYAVEITNRIAGGDLTSTIAIEPQDHESFLHAFKIMQDSLVKIVSDVRQSTDTISTASHQIASGNLDLSSRTEQQASSLEETASSMEELTSTVQQNADHATQANELALTASTMAHKGGNVVSEVVGTMSSIHASSKKIVDIISVIDGIAFQTNILALNAAVEAARAGEQGRGFAVVASEVRNLAQRSAAAAKEIKELIDDSVRQVDQGSKLVDQAGSAMTEIVASIERVTNIMADITAASQEQSAGIGQVNAAISHMDESTQQNAALVEQAAAAAQSMQEQAGRLAQAVDIFKLDTRALVRVA